MRVTALWWQWAECRGADQDIFFEDDADHEAEARAMCARCQVRQSCRREAMEETMVLVLKGDLNINNGFYGGMTPDERVAACYSLFGQEWT